METKNREKFLLILTGAAGVLWLLNLLVVSPLIASWHSRSDEIAKLKKEIADGAMLVRRQDTIRNRWDAMRANALASDLPAAERQMFTAFDHWVSSGGVTEGSFRPQVQEGDSNYSTVDCRSDVSGSPANVRAFLKAMSKDPLANKVDSFELTAKDDNGQQLTLGLSLSGLVLADSGPSLLPPPTNAMTPFQDTSLALDSQLDPFQIISRNNIFDQGRTPRDTERGPRIRMETISCPGVVFDNGVGSAYFEGNGIRTSGYYKVGDSINSELKIAEINLNLVTLTNSDSNTFVLSADGGASLRRENNGPWRRSGYIAADSAPDTSSTAPASSAPVSAAGASSIEEILKKRRLEQEQ
jgi:hypothetical protein